MYCKAKHTRPRLSPTERRERAQEALLRAYSSQSMSNYSTVIREFMDRGIPIDEIRPKENVFTFLAWRALGRHVRKGEHGVQIPTFVRVPESVDLETGEHKGGHSLCKTAVVFHLSQTDPDSPIVPPEPEVGFNPNPPV